MFIFGVFFILLLIALVAYAMGWRPSLRRRFPNVSQHSPLDELNERYARGEISRDEYEERRRTILQ